MSEDKLKKVEEAINNFWLENNNNKFSIDNPIVRLHEPTFDSEEIFAFTKQMLTTKVTMGEKVKEFEKSMQKSILIHTEYRIILVLLQIY